MLTVTLAVILAVPAADYPNPVLLIEPAALLRADPSRGPRILDARPRADYDKGHAPHAVWVNATAWAKSFGSGQNRDEWVKTIGGLGIDATTPVVVYDDAMAKDAARVWWILRYWGVKDVRLLNGGWAAWRAAGGKPTTETVRVTATTPGLAAQKARLATKDDLLALLKSPASQILDTRSEAEHCGEQKQAKRGGSIPGARHLEWSALLDEKTQRFKSADELAKLFADHGARLDQGVVTYCQSGGRAAVMAFALELMGAKDVRNYYRSWAEWGNAEDTPVVTPAKKPK